MEAYAVAHYVSNGHSMSKRHMLNTLAIDMSRPQGGQASSKRIGPYMSVLDTALVRAKTVTATAKHLVRQVKYDALTLLQGGILGEWCTGTPKA